MARPELKGREFSVYAPSKDDLIRWKQKAESLGMPLSGWVCDLIETKIEERPSVIGTRTSDEINRLRKENTDLKKEISRLTEIAKTSKRAGSSSQHPSQSVTDRLKDGHPWKYGELIRDSKTPDWVIVDAVSGRKKRVPNEPTEADITAFMTELLYTTIKILNKDTISKTVIIRPRDHAGAGDYVEMISKTIEELENLGLIEDISPRGWRWIK